MVDWDEHVDNHDVRWREYWLGQSVAVRLAGAMRCRRRVDGSWPPLDRTRLQLVDLNALDRE